MKLLKLTMIGIFLCSTPMLLTACEEESAIEQLGDDVDEATEEVADEIDDATTD